MKYCWQVLAGCDPGVLPLQRCPCSYQLDGSLTLAEAFVHEASRIFRDRLVGQDAVDSFNSLLAGMAATHLSFR
jgi:hypothetical protein